MKEAMDWVFVLSSYELPREFRHKYYHNTSYIDFFKEPGVELRYNEVLKAMLKELSEIELEYIGIDNNLREWMNK